MVASSSSQTKNIEDGNNEDFDLQLNIPLDKSLIGDVDDNFILFVKAFDDDNEAAACVQTSTSIDIELKNKKLIIDKSNTLFLPQIASCGDTIIANLKGVNIGEKDLTASVTLENKDLKINKKVQGINIESFNSDEENTFSAQIQIEIPENVKPKSYPFNYVVDFGSGSLTGSIPLQILSCDKSAGLVIEEINAGALINTPNRKFSLREGEFITIPVEITNNINKKTLMTLKFSEIGDFAQSVPRSILLNPSQKTTVFLELLVNEDIDPSQYSGIIEVLAEGSKIASESIIFEISEKPEKKISFAAVFATIPIWLFTIINLMLISILVISIKLITKSK